MWILHRIYYIDDRPSVIVAGDFNKLAMEKV
jgi:hypothetical protein